MSRDIKRQLDANSAECSEGVEAGRNSVDDTTTSRAGMKLGREGQGEEESEPGNKNTLHKPMIPLFMKGSPEGNKGNAQDEKDETEE